MKISLRNLDVLRAILATYVLAGHCRWLLWAGHANWVQRPHAVWANAFAYASALLRYGHEAVMVFFVLSGFFIHLRSAQELSLGKKFQFKISNYFARRAHRLIPPYLLALLVTVIIDAIGRHFWPTLYYGQTGDSLLDSNFARKGYSLNSVIPALSFLPSSLGMDFGSNGPLWSLAYEVVYYLVYPLWLCLRLSIGKYVYIIVAVLSPISFYLSGHGFIFIVAGHYYLWVAGAGVAEMICKDRVNKKKAGLLFIALCLVAGIAWYLFKSYLAVLIIYFVVGVGLVLGAGFWAEKWVPRFCYRILEQLGIRSYTIYICHFPLLTFISSWAIYTNERRPMSGWLAILGGATVLLTSVLLFELCEKRCLHTRLHV